MAKAPTASLTKSSIISRLVTSLHYFLSDIMIRFFAPEIEINPILPESDSQHAVRVLRMREGDVLEITDGQGHIFTCCLVEAHAKRAMVNIIDRRDAPLPWTQQITVAVAPTKHLDRMEWLVEKLVEIGVNDIVPLRCIHSERKEVKVERLEKIAVSAMKQSLKAVLPRIHPLTPLSQAFASISCAQKFIGYCAEDVPKVPLAKAYKPRLDTAVLIGPEGDFSPEEVAEAFEAGYRPVTLGDNRLRTETAALYACSAFHILDSSMA